MGYKSILVSEVGGVRTIRMNRPERRNAMTPEMQEELIAAFTEAGSVTSCRVVVLGGAGEAFCAGLDLTVLREMAAKTGASDSTEWRTELQEDAERLARLFRTLHELEKPTIAAVHGAAVAGGLGWLPSATLPWLFRRRSLDIRRCGSGLCRRWCRRSWCCRWERRERGICC